MTPRQLLRLVEIAELLGVSKQRADQLRRRDDFPAPVDRWARGDLWAAAAVDELRLDNLSLMAGGRLRPGTVVDPPGGVHPHDLRERAA